MRKGTPCLSLLSQEGASPPPPSLPSSLYLRRLHSLASPSERLPPPLGRLSVSPFLLLQAAEAVEPLLCTHSWEPGRQMCRCARSRERGRLLRGTVAHAENRAERSGRKIEGEGGVEGLNEGA